MDSKPKPYYEFFMDYVRANYMITEEECEYFTVLYDARLKTWYEYGTGVYRQIYKTDVERIYLVAMNAMDFPTTTQQKNHCLDYLRVNCQMREEWMDNSPTYDCIANGIVNLQTRELLPHSPKWYFRNQIERNFNPHVDPVIPPRFLKCLNAIADKDDRNNYLKFWLAVVHKKHDYEVFLMCYGVKWGGKSSNLNIFAQMYGTQVVSKKALQLIGKRFGLSNIYHKRVNIHADMPIVNLDPFTISILKTITGNDGDIEIELKGVTAFEYRIALFMAFGINQLMGFTQNAEKEVDSIMRRVVLVEFPDIQKLDAEFKKSLLDPHFLDRLYSWFVISSPLPLFEESNQIAWIQRNKKKWLLNADPVLRILLENYAFAEHVTITSTDVISFVRSELESEGMLVPKNLKLQITNAFSTMDIFPNDKRGTKALYLNVRPIDVAEQEYEDFLAEEIGVNQK